ncbi:hypothetical protein OUZ56_006706 [Daphnia magna]|uniref:Uncharacterized protein n=1 Tax=Daphnia magna TaxID=35525 RepID=A0ABQ9YWG2_9CRUS|nr:hypothetical protein OUZ56_006706 [Daphnia magna]
MTARLVKSGLKTCPSRNSKKNREGPTTKSRIVCCLRSKGEWLLLLYRTQEDCQEVIPCSRVYCLVSELTGKKLSRFWQNETTTVSIICICFGVGASVSLLYWVCMVSDKEAQLTFLTVSDR